VTYFIRSKAAFSLWGMYFLINLFQVQYGMRGGTELGSAALQDQHLGAVVAFVAGIFWIGREHWKRVISNSLRPSGGDRTYRGPFWVAVGGTAVMLAWLLTVGVQLFIAILIIVVILTAHLVVARVVAETGLPLYRAGISPAQIYGNLPVSLWSGRDMYFASVGQVLGPLTTRDSIMSFTATGLGIAHSAHVEEDETGAANPPRRPHRRLGLIIAWTLVVGFMVAAASTLYCQYSYPTPLTEDIKPQGNYFGASYIPRRDIAPPVVYHSNNSYLPRRHSRLLHVTIGLLLTAGLQFASLRWTTWPLLPVGYVASYGAFVGNAWFSIFLGWLAKVMIVRFGGSSLFLKARPLFVGIIFGEALAAGIWLIINAIAVMNGADMKSFKILP
jgi:hypothetical protein